MSETAIKVAARLRPALPGEDPISPDQLILNEEDGTFIVKNNSFCFDHVFSTYLSNKDIYNKMVAEKIPHILDGYNVTILAYGPTGSGKTFTMGTAAKDIIKNISEADIGLIPRGLQDIFNACKNISDSTDSSIKASFLELYKEELHDLMQKPDSNTCTLRGDGEDIKISNLTEKVINCVDEAIDMLECGIRARHTEATAKNMASSRSHAIFCVTITLTDKSNGQSKRAKFQLVDLAGSERAQTSKTEGEKFKQGININKALMTLGRVINSIVKKERHIPYRDSTLTRLLQDSFGGNSHTVMIACVNPSISSIEETLSTLRYASNARNIKNRPVVNKDSKEEVISRLRKQIAYLENELVTLRAGSRNSPSRDNADFFRMNSTMANLKEALSQAEDKRNAVYLKLKEVDNEIKKLISDITAKSALNDPINEYLSNLESIENKISELLICKDVTIPIGSNASNTSLTITVSEDTLSTSSDAENMSWESSEEIVMDARKKQVDNVRKLEQIEQTLKDKETQMKSYENFTNILEATVNEEAYNELFKKIQMLTEEKERLVTEQEISKEKIIGSKERIQALEKEIQTLREEVQRSKMFMQLKKDNKNKEILLQQEIQALKKGKVQLLKQIKEDSNKYTRLIREADKKVAKLEKQGRKAEIQLVKMKSFFERRLNVLQNKVLIAQSSCKAASRTQKMKSVNNKTKNIKDGVENYVDELLKEAIFKEKNKFQIECLEKTAEMLNQHLKELADDCKDKLMSEEDKITYTNVQNSINDVLNQIDELKKKMPAESKEETSPWSTISVISDAIKALESIFKKSVSSEIENFKKIEELDEELKRKNSIIEELKATNQETEDKICELEAEISESRAAQERKLSLLNEEWESKMLIILEQSRKMSSITVANENNLNTLKKLQEMESELLEKRLLMNDYEKKCAEVEKLQEELKRRPRLKRIMPSFKPEIKQESTEDDMIEEYLDDDDDDPMTPDRKANDPDFRATPLYKRKKLTNKRKSEEKAEDSKVSPKRQCTGCSCPSDCRTMRCSCRKKHKECTSSCSCLRNACVNVSLKSGMDVTF